MKNKLKKQLRTLLAIIFCLTAFAGCDFSALEQDNDLNASTGTSSSISASMGTEENEEEENVRYWRDTKNFGIHVTDGVMTLGNEKVYEAGINCYNLFNQCFSDGYSVEKAKKTLNILADYGIKVVRFNCGGYAMNYISDYFAQKTAYIKLLCEIAEYAETLEIGLIPSFFWLYHAVPDYYDEPINSWGKTESQTMGFLKSYTKDVVMALKDYKAIFAWEFGNEFNLSCDLPNAFEHMPALPAGSKRLVRTEEDILSASDVEIALTAFAQTIKSVDDTGRMITSGNATMRPSQYNQWMYNTWKQDTTLEYKNITAMFAPTGVDTVCEHVYFTSQNTFGKELTLAEYLQYATANAKALNKAYFVGEWGGGSSNDREYYSQIGHAFVDAGVQLALLWNFNAAEGSVEYSFSADTTRGKMLLSILADMNAAYEAKY